jgi:acetylornithine deacetylase/succinyl-diaminopimelate desuccinylase-like protein
MRVLAPSLIAACLFSTVGVEAQQGEGRALARAYHEAHAAEILDEYRRLLSLPNVASDAVGIRANADTLVARLQAVGVEAETWTLPDAPDAPPIVFGVRRSPGASRTVGIYVHYDGQPADPTNWTHAPWEPELYDGPMYDGGTPIPFPSAGEAVDPEWRLYARSAGDDKAPLGALFPVLRALNDAGVEPTANLKFFFEGEEEAGSPNLERYLTAYRDEIDDIDVWLIFDGPVHQSGRPQVVFGVRGVTGLDLTVYGPTRPLHSGHYGNWAPVPGQMLADLLDSMKDADTGEVLIEGFYDSVDPLGPDERAALARLPDVDAALRRDLSLGRTEGEPSSLAERLLLPSLTVRGILSGNVGTLARNVIPSTAQAALGIRLVKGNEPGAMLDLVEAHVRSEGWHIVYDDPSPETLRSHAKVVKIERGGGYPAARTSMDSPEAAEVVRAAREVGGDDVLLVPSLGGSLPLYLFTELLAKPTIVVPVANHDNNQHAPDENLRIANLWYAMELYGALLTLDRPRMED